MWFFVQNSLRAFAVSLGQRLRQQGTSHPLQVEVLCEFMREIMRRALVLEPREVRRVERPMPIPPGLRRRVRLASTEVAGLPALEVVPRRSPKEGLLLFFHGGGYNFCSPGTHRTLVTRLALRTGLRCLAPDYRLAPEHPYPAAVDDGERIVQALLDDGVDPAELWIGGDSAGGGLTLATLLRLRAAGLPLPRAAFLLSPWVDLTCSGESIVANEPTDYLSRQCLLAFAANYLGDTPATTPFCSPLHADLTGLPPLLVQVGGAETLLSEGRALAERARAAGVEVTLQEWDDAIHAFQVMGPLVPQSAPAIRAIAAFVAATRD